MTDLQDAPSEVGSIAPAATADLQDSLTCASRSDELIQFAAVVVRWSWVAGPRSGCVSALGVIVSSVTPQSLTHDSSLGPQADPRAGRTQ